MLFIEILPNDHQKIAGAFYGPRHRYPFRALEVKNINLVTLITLFLIMVAVAMSIAEIVQRDATHKNPGKVTSVPGLNPSSGPNSLNIWTGLKNNCSGVSHNR